MQHDIKAKSHLSQYSERRALLTDWGLPFPISEAGRGLAPPQGGWHHPPSLLRPRWSSYSPLLQAQDQVFRGLQDLASLLGLMVSWWHQVVSGHSAPSYGKRLGTTSQVRPAD